jgi:4-aminobutyrate aminotransferase/(S)-3-amino-2-methylpropionate transaminase
MQPSDVAAKIDTGEDILSMRKQYVPAAVTTPPPVFVAEARGAVVRASNGRSYLDFASGIGVLAVGHSHPKVVTAIQRQAELYIHTSFPILMYEPYVTLCRRLASLAPGSFPKKTFLANSGAEAVENAVKLARAYTKRPAVIAFEGAFHGRTLLGLSLTGKIHPYKAGFGPFVPDVYRMPFPYPYRPPAGVRPEDTVSHALDAVEALFRATVAPDQVAAIIVEPVLGEGGFVVPPAGFLAALRDLCRARSLVLIMDEIQTGFGRTGRMFACEHEGVEPDLLVLGKSLAAGMPLAAVVGRAEIMDTPSAGGLGGTYGGNPVACAAALAVLDIFEEEGLLRRAQAIAGALHGRLENMMARSPLIGEVRGLGPMVAMELVQDRVTRAPAPEATNRVIRACWDRGLIILKAGIYDNVIRVHVPFVITDAQLEEGLDILESALAEGTPAA